MQGLTPQHARKEKRDQSNNRHKKRNDLIGIGLSDNV